MDEECESITDAELAWYVALPLSEQVRLLKGDPDEEEIERMKRAYERRQAEELSCVS